MLTDLATCPSSTEQAISVPLNLPMLLGIKPYHNALLSPVFFGNLVMLIKKITRSPIIKPAGGDLCHASSVTWGEIQSQVTALVQWELGNGGTGFLPDIKYPPTPGTSMPSLATGYPET